MMLLIAIINMAFANPVPQESDDASINNSAPQMFDFDEISSSNVECADTSSDESSSNNQIIYFSKAFKRRKAICPAVSPERSVDTLDDSARQEPRNPCTDEGFSNFLTCAGPEIKPRPPRAKPNIVKRDVVIEMVINCVPGKLHLHQRL